MSSARPSTRALRVGVVLSDTVIAEHVVRSGTAFTIGQSIRNLVPLPIPGLPRRWQLLELVENGVLLRLAPGMNARVAVGGQVLGRADLDQRGAATRTATLVTLPSGSHGKLDLGGDVKVLFQELTMPLPAPAPALPRAVKGTLADRIDRRMAVFAAASVLVHVGIMTAASLHDAPGDSSLSQRALAQYTPETISIIDADDPILDLDPAPADDPTAPGAAAAPTPTPSPSPTPADHATNPRPARPRPSNPAASDPAQLGEDATRLAELLFADDGKGKLTSDLANRRPGSDLDKQLTEVRDSNANVAIGKPTGRDPSDGKPRIGTTEGPLIDDPGDVARVDDDKLEQQPKTRIDIVPKPPREPGTDITQIVAKIRHTYVGGLQRCYKKALGPQPGLAGKVALTFTVTERGGVSDGSATGVDDGFESCVEGLMTRWSFSPVTDEDGDATEVDLGITLQLSI